MVCSGYGSLLTERRVFEAIPDPGILQATHRPITPGVYRKFARSIGRRRLIARALESIQSHVSNER